MEKYKEEMFGIQTRFSMVKGSFSNKTCGKTSMDSTASPKT